MTKKREYPAIISKDGKAITVGQLLYRPAVYVSDYREERHSAEVEVFRVIDQSLQHRTMRLRCAEGCETFVRVDNACSRAGYFASEKTAKSEATKSLKKGIADLGKKVNELKKLAAAVKNLKIKTAATPV